MLKNLKYIFNLDELFLNVITYQKANSGLTTLTDNKKLKMYFEFFKFYVTKCLYLDSGNF